MIRGYLLSVSVLLAVACEQSGESTRVVTTAPFGQTDKSGAANNPFAGSGSAVPAPTNGGGGGGAGGANAALIALQAAVDKNTAVTFNNDLKPLVDKYCVSCHSGGSPQGGLNLETFAAVKESVKKMESRIRNGTMPPKANELSDEAKVRLADLEVLLGVWQDNPSSLAEDLSLIHI